MLIFISAGLLNTIQAQNGWTQMEDMDIERNYFRSCLLDNSIYIFGGEDKEHKYLSSAKAYDIGTNKWTSLVNLPNLISDPHVCELNKKIYIIGGWHMGTATSWPSNLNFEYNPELDGYSAMKNCPSVTASSPSCALDNKIYIFGNRDSSNQNPQKKVFRYDPVTDNWDTLPGMIHEHTLGDAVSLDNKIYLLGGAVESGVIYYSVHGKSEMFDPETNSWTELKDMPFPVANHTSIVHNNKILVFGGDSAYFQYINSVYGSKLIQEYDPLTDSWRLMEGMPFYRSGHAAQKLGDLVFIIGGVDRPEHKLKEVWRFDLNYLEAETSTNELLQSTVSLFTLHQNYPNPFTGSTKISYELGESGSVKLEILNLLGQQITTLVHEMKNPGSYCLNWNAEGLNPGVYFCRLKMGDSEKVIKLLILR